MLGTEMDPNDACPVVGPVVACVAPAPKGMPVGLGYDCTGGEGTCAPMSYPDRAALRTFSGSLPCAINAWICERSAFTPARCNCCCAVAIARSFAHWSVIPSPALNRPRMVSSYVPPNCPPENSLTSALTSESLRKALPTCCTPTSGPPGVNRLKPTPRGDAALNACCACPPVSGSEPPEEAPLLPAPSPPLVPVDPPPVGVTGVPKMSPTVGLVTTGAGAD